MPNKPLILASASPRRAELLRQIALPFEVCPPAVDESPGLGESAAERVRRLAILKAQAAHRRGCLALAADTLVELDDEAFGKPRGRQEGLAMLAALGGRSHRVVTGVCLTDGQSPLACVVATEVALKPISAKQAQAYWRTGEPADKAGGYGIQGIGGIFVEHIRGSYSAVVGLPLAETEELLKRFKFDSWRHRLARAAKCPKNC